MTIYRKINYHFWLVIYQFCQQWQPIAKLCLFFLYSVSNIPLTWITFTNSVNIITSIQKIYCRLIKIGNTNDPRIIYDPPASKRPARQEVNSVLTGTRPAGARRSTASPLVPTQLVPPFPSDLRSRAMRLAGGVRREIFSPKGIGAPARWVPAGSFFTS